MEKKSGIGSAVKREFMRAMMERSQSLDLKQVMAAFGAVEPAVYDDVEEQLNIAYVNRSEVALAMDVFKPKAPEGTELPVILLIHGGGLFMGDRGLDRPYSRLLAHKGYMVFSLEYRLAPKANYGMSETGSKLMFAPHGNKRDILGFAKDRDSFRIKDEQDGQFYRPEDGPRTGLLYICSDVGSGNELDGKVIFEYTQIDGRQYVCTNDLVQVNEDGSLSYAGRTDQFFVNNKGQKFDSGIVNRCLSAHSAVENCAVVPVMEKRINDTVPVLFVVPSEKGPGAAESIRKALVDVYVKEKQIGADNLPTQFMLVNEIPLNANGKLDIFRITRQRMTGDAYDLVPIMENEALTDIRTKHMEQANGFTAGTLPEGMENHSAYNFFDFFQAAGTGEQKSAGGWNPPHPIWPFFGADKRKKQKMPEELWKAVLKYGNRLVGLSTGRKSYDFDFED